MNETKNEKARELVKLLASECGDLGDIQKLLKNLFAGTIEEMLESEMEEHLGYDKHSTIGNNSGNSRNGYNKKTIQSEFGTSDCVKTQGKNQYKCLKY
jgi:putative transposase